MTIDTNRFRLYRRLLQLYPEPYRTDYAEQMLQTVTDMFDNASTWQQRATIWLRIAADMVLSIPAQQTIALGEIMAHETPTYVKRNSLVAALMLAPFWLALIANTLDKIAFGHTLYSSLLWRTPLLSVWVLWLPLIAAILTLATLIIFVKNRQNTTGVRLRALLDIRQDWPLIVVALMCLGILAIVLGHDSVHCIVGNPIRELRNPIQTWQCIQQGAATYPLTHPIEVLKRAFEF